MTFDQLKRRRSVFYLACLAAFICLMTIKLSYFVPTVMSMGQIYFLVKCLALLISCKFIFLDDLSIKAKLLTVTAIIIFYFLAKISQDSNVFYYAILIVGAFDVDFDEILKNIHIYCRHHHSLYYFCLLDKNNSGTNRPTCRSISFFTIIFGILDTNRSRCPVFLSINRLLCLAQVVLN